MMMMMMMLFFDVCDVVGVNGCELRHHPPRTTRIPRIHRVVPGWAPRARVDQSQAA